MTDLTIARDSELMVAQVEGETAAGIAWIDAYTALDLVVVDAGRIIIPEAGLFALRERARAADLTMTESVLYG